MSSAALDNLLREVLSRRGEFETQNCNAVAMDMLASRETSEIRLLVAIYKSHQERFAKYLREGLTRLAELQTRPSRSEIWRRTEKILGGVITTCHEATVIIAREIEDGNAIIFSRNYARLETAK